MVCLLESKWAAKKLCVIVVTFEPVSSSDGTFTPFTTKSTTVHVPTSCCNSSGETGVEPRSAPSEVWLKTTEGASFPTPPFELIELLVFVAECH